MCLGYGAGAVGAAGARHAATGYVLVRYVCLSLDRCPTRVAADGPAVRSHPFPTKPFHPRVPSMKVLVSTDDATPEVLSKLVFVCPCQVTAAS